MTHHQAVPLSRLGLVGQQVGEPGGQGSVYELVEHPGWLYKRYHEGIPVEPAGLLALVRWYERLEGRDRRIIDCRTAWPRYVVEHEQGFGVVFRRAPRRFTHAHGGRRVATSLEFVCCAEGAWGGAGPGSPRAAVAIVYRYAQVLDVLHRGGVAYGDLSFTNMFWSSATPRPHIMLIDCDAAWHTAGPRGVPPGETYLWTDPWGGSGAAEAQAVDLFKLGLLFMRSYYNTINDFVGPSTRSLTLGATRPISRRMSRLLEAALAHDPARRQEAAAHLWLEPLLALERRLDARGIL